MTAASAVVSIVVPCFNEEASILPFLAELDLQAPRLPPVEVIFVDDGSTDHTSEFVLSLGTKRGYPVRLVRLSRNFGHQLAILAGLREARGQACVTIDVDLQDPPATIVEMVRLWREGYSVVIGERSDRQSDTWFKRFTAGAFYRLIALLTKGDFPEHAGDFRLIDRRVMDIMAQSREMGPYWRGLAVWVGFPRAVVSYRRQPRQVGHTKFHFTKMLSFGLDAIFSFSRRPLQLASCAGALVSVLSLSVVAIHVVWLLTGQSAFVRGWLSIVSMVGLIGGIQLICLGILGEYVGRIYELSLGRPNVIIQESRLVSQTPVERPVESLLSGGLS
jgi:dolichol-phosphate mannosyltransferase